MNSITVFEYHGQRISKREDGFINLTQMCQANGKRLDVFMKAIKNKEYIDTLSNYHQMTVVYSEKGVNGGTWGHPSLAINLARWISPAFAVWCDTHIFNLMSTGSTSLSQPPQTYLEALKALVASEERKALLEAEKKLLEAENHQLAEAVDELFNYSSIVRVAKYNNIPETRFSWRKLKVTSDKMGIEIKKVPCPRFESKNLYCHDVWRLAYPGISLPETTTLIIK